MKGPIFKRIEIKLVREVELAVTLIQIKLKKYSCVLLNTPLHGNLGDHAIALAELQWIRKRLPDVKCIEIPGDVLDEDWKHHILDSLKRKKLKYIFFTGGGNLGSLWMDDENRFVKAVEYFEDSNIIVFPQTIYFEDNQIGRKEMDRFLRVVKKRSLLKIIVRESQSFHLIEKKAAKQNLFLAPDIVMTYEYKKEGKRSDILVCFRDDKEVKDKEIRSSIIEAVRKKYGAEKIIRTNTDMGIVRIPRCLRKLFVNWKLKEFSQAKIVVTDRLHGMIFALITGTACIAIDNLSGKISSVYRWIQDIPFVYLIRNKDDINEVVDKLDVGCEYSYDVGYFREKFDRIMAEVLNEYEWN